MIVDIVAGLKYSDEGKGHVCQMLSEGDYDVYMRVNGSWSSSHQISDNQYGYHLPSTLRENLILIVGKGMFVKPDVLIMELDSETRKKQHIYIHEDCPVILVQGQKNASLGTLGSGVRQASIDRLNHHGKVLKDVIADYPKLANYLINNDKYYDLIKGKKILIEGSHGYLIDRTHGEYPETTSTDTTPTAILALAELSPEMCRNVIFVDGLFTSSLGIHTQHQKYSQFGLEKMIEFIPDNIRTDKACGIPTLRNFGPLSIDATLRIIRFYPSCKIVYNFYDVIEKMQVFYYILNGKLCSLESSTDFKEKIRALLEEKLQRRIVINEF